jgi:hypothetical protein
MTGVAVTYTIPSSDSAGRQVYAVAFKARGADITVKMPSTATGSIVVKDGDGVRTSDPNDGGAIWSFNGTAGSYVDIILTVGVPE